MRYFPFWDLREQKQNFQVNYPSVFTDLKSHGEEMCAGGRYNSLKHCTDRVHVGQTSPVSPANLLEQAAATQKPAV